MYILYNVFTYLFGNVKNIPNKYVNTLYKIYINDKPKKIPEIDKTNPRYKILLEYINNILQNIGKDQINDIRQFKKIDRKDICTEKNRLMLVNMADKIFRHFNKIKCNYYVSQGKVTHPFNVLRNLCKKLGFQLKLTRTKQYIKEMKMYKDVRLYTII
jgi:hypothetical protein